MSEPPPEPFDTVGDEHVEARIVAWVLGESSAFETAELERLCGERPELEVFRRRIQEIQVLVREAAASEADKSWKLPPEKRLALDAKFGVEVPPVLIAKPDRERHVRRSSRRALWGIAACLVLTVVVIQMIYPTWVNQTISPPMKVVNFMPSSSGGGNQAEKISALDNAIRDQEDKIEERRKVLATIVRTKGIIYKGADSSYGYSGVDEDQAAGSPSEVVGELEKTREKIKSQLDEKTTSNRESLKAQLALTEDRLSKVEALKSDTRNDAIERGMDAQDYVDARRNFESDQDLLQAMKQKRTELAVGKEMAGASMAMNGPAPAPPGAPPAAEEPRFRMESKSLSDRQMDMKQKASQSQLARRATEKPRVFAEGAQSTFALPESAPALADAGKMPLQSAQGGFGGRSGGGSAFGLRSAEETDRRNNVDAILNDGSEVSAPARQQSSASIPTLTARDAATRRAGAADGASAGALGLADSFAEPAAATAVAGKLEAGAAAKDMPSLASGNKGWASDAEPPSARPVLDDLAQRETTRRQDAVVKGDKLLKNGRDAYSNGDYKKAAQQYDEALKALPDSPLLADRRKSYAGHLADANVAQAMQNRKVGKYKEAEELLHEAVTLDPKNEGGKRELGYLEDPIRSNPALTEAGAGASDKVRRGLYVGEGNMNLGKYDDAKKSYEEVLKTDPTNAAARRGLEKVEAAKSDYYRAAYDQSRAELLSRVDSDWKLSIPDGKADDGEAPAAPIAAPKEEKARDAEPVLEPETSAAENPYSTFSLHVSDASFQLAKAVMDKGGRPEPAEVKVEQFYNAVDYGDPAPGADQPVAATIEQCANPVVPGRNLVRVALRTASAGRGAAQALRITLLVDQSGSMVREDRRAAMDRALGQLGGLLTENDRVTIVGFSRTPRLLAEDLSGPDGKKLGDIINQAASEGGTNLEEAMKLGAQMAERHQLAGAQNRIVLFTDGAANLGNADPDKLEEQVKSLRQKGIAFDIAGIGTDGLNDRLLAQLARHGNGRYYVVGADQKDDLARQLAGAFRPAAENVKVQVIFNPQRVGNYKLIGFEQDRLKTEDFRNDSVDAAELAADEAGVALYQVQPLADGSGEIGEVSVRFRDVASGEMVERSWTIPYEESASAFDRASPSMQLAGLAMMAGEKLRGGEMAGAIEFKKFAGSVAEVRKYYGKSERVGEMLGVVERLK